MNNVGLVWSTSVFVGITLVDAGATLGSFLDDGSCSVVCACAWKV